MRPVAVVDVPKERYGCKPCYSDIVIHFIKDDSSVS